jgi:TonB-linked SusC/RagA family outer membrane protein
MKNISYNRVIRKFLFFLITFVFSNIYAQKTLVKGTVVSSNGILLLGASVLEKGTNNGVEADFDGNFSITVSDKNGILKITYLGYTTKEVTIQNKSFLKIVLQEDTASLDEIVVVGYGSLNKKNVTGSVGKVTASELENFPDVSFQNKLAGKLAGVSVLQTTGTPGGNVSIRIRGTGSISAGNDPLIVVDGFPISDGHNSASTQGSRPGSSTRQENPQNALSTINPNDIESIEVLKDAAAAAIYGSRGANGVILITTKKGADGKPSFSFNASAGLQEVTTTYDMMDAYEFAEQNYVARRNGGTLAGYRPEWLPYLNDEPGLVNTDWQDALYREAFMENYDLSVKGGSKNLKYYVSGNFANQDGIILGSGYKRYALRAKLDANLSDNVRLGVNVSPSLTISDLVPTENPYFVDGVVNLALLSIPTESIYNADGSFNFNQNTASGSGPFVNPIAIANLVEDELKQTRFLLGTYLEIDFLKDFTFRTQLGADFSSWNRAYYRPSSLPVRGTLGPSVPTARNFSTQSYNWITENTITFDKTFKEKHHVNALVGFTAQKDRRERNSVFGTNFPDDRVQTLNAAGLITSARSDVSEWSLLSYLSRVTYDFEGKYLITASIRTDGASRFGSNTKWGYFPSVSAGWRVSDMNFFKSKTINDLKLRASYGETGNFGIPNYGAIALLGDADYVLNDAQVNGAAPSTAPNEDLTWEKNSAINLGLDLSLFNSKLVFNADYYISTTKGLLFNLPVPGSSGFSNSLQNIGEIENKGLELSVTNNMTIGDFKIVTNANIATNRNKVLSTGRNNAPIISNGGVSGTHITKVGEPVGSYYGLNVLGVFTTQEQLDSKPHEADAALGDFIFEDLNNDGFINANDRTITGSFFPDYIFGLNSTISYKGLDFNIAVQGKQNFEVLHLAQRYLGSLQTFSNYRADIYNNAYISPSNPGNGEVYRPNSSPTNSNDAISSYHVEDASYVRIQNITLGYSFEKQALKRIGNIQRLRVYATAVNPFTFTNYSGYNPDVNQRPNSALSQGEDYGTYPLAKSILLGVNVSF